MCVSSRTAGAPQLQHVYSPIGLLRRPFVWISGRAGEARDDLQPFVRKSEVVCASDCGFGTQRRGRRRTRGGGKSPPGIEEAGAQDHDGLAGALLELHLDGAELAVDDVHHALDLLGRNRPRARLLPQQVHHVGGELVTRLWRGHTRTGNVSMEVRRKTVHILFTAAETHTQAMAHSI